MKPSSEDREWAGFSVRSDAIDELLSSFLEMPAKVSWEGALADSVRGSFEGVRLELAGLAVLALPFERLVLSADRFQFTPGVPARIDATRPRIEVSIDQRQVDTWLKRARAPFELRLIENAIEFQMQIGPVPLTRTETELSVRRGWFVMRPRHAEFLGVRARLVSLFRTAITQNHRSVDCRHAGRSQRLSGHGGSGDQS